MAKKILYKVLGTKKQSIHGGRCNWKVGKFTPRRKNPSLCRRGYHLVDKYHVEEWIYFDELEVWEAEGKGKFDYSDAKIAFEQARIIRKVYSGVHMNNMFSFLEKERKRYLAKKRKNKKNKLGSFTRLEKLSY